MLTYLVCETHITWPQFAKENCNNLLVRILDASAKPNKEWSVKTVGTSINWAWNMAS